MLDKRSALLRLAKVRQNTRWPGYKCIGDYDGGVYECDFVSPYTKGAGNVDAEVMFILQDWTSDESLSKGFDEDLAKLGYSRHVRTNINLKDLLNTIFGLSFAD